jgi:hypothetical protein
MNKIFKILEETITLIISVNANTMKIKNQIQQLTVIGKQISIDTIKTQLINIKVRIIFSNKLTSKLKTMMILKCIIQSILRSKA